MANRPTDYPSFSDYWADMGDWGDLDEDANYVEIDPDERCSQCGLLVDACRCADFIDPVREAVRE